MDLSRHHLAILRAIGEHGATRAELVGVGMPREFDDLRHAGLIVYWPDAQPRPPRIFGSSDRSGSWYLTLESAEAAGLEMPPLRLS